MIYVYILLAIVIVLQLAILASTGRALRAQRAQPAVTVTNVASTDWRLPDASVAREPVDLRPDPTARFNVFRLDENGALVLSDAQRYTGNDADKAMQAAQAFSASEWRGRVYVFEHNQQLRVLD